MLIAGQPSKGQNNTSGKLADGIYGKKGVITKVKQELNKQLGPNYQPHYYIEFTIKVGKYDNLVSMFGNYNIDPQSQQVTGFGLVKKVDNTFLRFGAYEGLTDEQKVVTNRLFNEAVLDNMIGKPAYFLSCVIGKQRNADKPAYQNYGFLLPFSESFSDEEHYEQLYDILKSDNWMMENRIAPGQQYLRESRERYLASKSSEFNTTSSATAKELSYEQPSSTQNERDDLIFWSFIRIRVKNYPGSFGFRVFYLRKQNEK